MAGSWMILDDLGILKLLVGLLLCAYIVIRTSPMDTGLPASEHRDNHSISWQDHITPKTTMKRFGFEWRLLL